MQTSKIIANFFNSLLTSTSSLYLSKPINNYKICTFLSCKIKSHSKQKRVVSEASIAYLYILNIITIIMVIGLCCAFKHNN